MTSPSGARHALRAGPYSAVVRSVGATLQSLRWNDRDLVLPFGDDELRPAFRGAVLAPWPNRVGDGRWTWQGQQEQLALTEPERGHAMHGLVAWSEWRTVEHTDDAVTLTTTLWPQPGYPFQLDLTMRWSLDEERGLSAELTASNAGPEPAPYGCAIHPYLVAPGGSVDEWVLHVPADRELQVDGRLLPTELVDVPAAHDFRTRRPVDDAQMDNAFTGVHFDRGEAHVTVTDADGNGARVTFGEATPWVQVCTSDWPGASHRAGLAVEPMTCPPNALASGTDLVVLEPGSDHVVSWQIRNAVPGSGE
ncbi:MAG: aldose 1-epimerase family protein [Acidimicrobiia bacterium]|nr:aldose 1-epimerase family protein [Acidimicrobiia bacterium]